MECDLQGTENKRGQEKLDETLNSYVRRVVEHSGGSGRWGVMRCWSGRQ
jgi:hypothetical protein